MRYQCLSPQAFLATILRRRKLSEDARLETPLDRCLNVGHLIMYSMASTIGVGLYVLTGTLIRDTAGAGTALAYAIAGFSAVFTGACYAEFSTLIPRAGSAYAYTYLMLGELPAFLIGWTMISDVIVSLSSISKAFSGAINIMTGYQLSNWSDTNLARLADYPAFERTPDIVAFLFIFTLVLFSLLGAKSSLTFNAVMSSIQVICLTAIIIAGFVLGSEENLTSDGGFLPFGFSGVINAAGIAAFAFSGFESLANASEECKNPKRDIPIALFTSFAVCIVLYITGSMSMAYLIPRNLIDIKSPFPAGFARLDQAGLMWFASISTLIATGVTKIVAMFVIPRMIYAMASDGLLFGFLGYVEPRTQVPIFALFIGGSFCMLLAMFFNIRTLADFTSIGVIFSYYFIGVDLLVLRYLFDDEDNVLQELSSSSDSERSGKGLNNTVTACDDLKRKLGHAESLPIRAWARPIVDQMPNFCNRFMFRVWFIVYAACLVLIALAAKFLMFYGAYLALLMIIGIFSAFALISFFFLCTFEPKVFYDAYETRLMPLCPCVTMLTNTMLIFTLPGETWLRFFIWLLIGLVIYFSYGMWHSKVESDSSELEPLTGSQDRTDSQDNSNGEMPIKT